MIKIIEPQTPSIPHYTYKCHNCGVTLEFDNTDFLTSKITKANYIVCPKCSTLIYETKFSSDRKIEIPFCMTVSISAKDLSGFNSALKYIFDELNTYKGKPIQFNQCRYGAIFSVTTPVWNGETY